MVLPADLFPLGNTLKHDNTMKNEYDFFEIVKIDQSVPVESKAIAGAEGTILGMAQDDNGRWTYSVSIGPDGICWSIYEKYLARTGRFSDRSDFYDGDSLRVIVDPNTGEGRALDEQ